MFGITPEVSPLNFYKRVLVGSEGEKGVGVNETDAAVGEPFGKDGA
jgi:hypothetical protein